MCPDSEILRVIQKLPENQLFDLQRVRDEYISACEQSREARPDQALHWKRRALQLEEYLRKRLGIS